MSDPNEEAHKEHLRYEQEHLQFTADHMRALAILKRIEAHLFQHEAEIAAHRAEITRHEETISHGDAHTTPPADGEHERMGHAHDSAGQNHSSLMTAIFELEKLV